MASVTLTVYLIGNQHTTWYGSVVAISHNIHLPVEPFSELKPLGSIYLYKNIFDWINILYPSYSVRFFNLQFTFPFPSISFCHPPILCQLLCRNSLDPRLELSLDPTPARDHQIRLFFTSSTYPHQTLATCNSNNPICLFSWNQCDVFYVEKLEIVCRGFDFWHFHSFKCRLGLEQGSSSLMQTLKLLLHLEVADLINKVNLSIWLSVMLITLFHHTSICQSFGEV